MAIGGLAEALSCRILEVQVKLSRCVGLASICLGLAFAAPASAQPKGKGGPERGPGGGPDVRRLEEELRDLKARNAELEAQLRRAREGERKDADRRPEPPRPGGDRRPESDRRPEPPRGFGPPMGFGGFRQPFGFGPPMGKGPGGFGPPGWMGKRPEPPRPSTAPMPRPADSRSADHRHGPHHGPGFRGHPESMGHNDALRKIDDMIRELESLKRSLSRR